MTAPDVQMSKPQPDPVDNQLEKELEMRANHAAQEAAWFEEAARRHRAVERACRNGLESLMSSGEQSVPMPAEGYR